MHQQSKWVVDHLGNCEIFEDPETGLPNVLALFSDFRRLVAEAASGIIAILGVTSDAGASGQQSTQPSNSSVPAQFASALLKAAKDLGDGTVHLYRLVDDEFCAIFPRRARIPASWWEYLSREVYPTRFAQAVTEFSPQQPVIDAFLQAWANLHDDLQGSQDGASPSYMVARHMIESVSATVDLVRFRCQLAFIDDITGLPNHRAALELIRENLRSHQSASKKFSLLFVDGDNLRLYNDNLGYSSGNEVIRRLGSMLAEIARPGEVVTRWLSGDEFMIILPEHDKQQAVQRAEEICSIVRSRTADWAYPSTVSIGVVTYPEDGIDVETLLQRAEEANSRAKQLGKDRVWHPS